MMVKTGKTGGEKKSWGEATLILLGLEGQRKISLWVHLPNRVGRQFRDVNELGPAELVTTQERREVLMGYRRKNWGSFRWAH